MNLKKMQSSEIAVPKLILIDIGNSQVRAVTWTAEDYPSSPEYRKHDNDLPETRRLSRLGSWPTPVAEAIAEDTWQLNLSQSLSDFTEIPVVLVSVVPRLTTRLQDLWPQLILADHSGHLPFEMRFENPSEVGADRICNVAAAAAAGLADAIVVDAGTATTVDVLKNGCYVGGLIAPGMASAGEALSGGTARLPVVGFESSALVAEKSTAAAMRTGIFHAGIGGAEALIAGMLAQFGPVPIVLTGGLGKTLLAPGRCYDPDWTFRGAAEIARMRQL